MYRAIREFTDSGDNRHRYRPGDAYPREGYKASAVRIAELSSTRNRQKVPLIEKVADGKPAKAAKAEKAAGKAK